MCMSVDLAAPHSKKTQGVALDQGHQTLAAALAGPKHPAVAWGVHVSREPEPWPLPQIGPMSVKAKEITTMRGTCMQAMEPAALPKKQSKHLMDAACGHGFFFFFADGSSSIPVLLLDRT